jgi:hypothetical protein
MMFLINDAGVPSVAKYVRVGDTGVPAAPSQLTAVATSGTQVYLSWQDNANNETGFVVERRGSRAPFSVIATLPANTTSFLDSGRTPNIQYQYRVRAVGTQGASAYSNQVGLRMPSGGFFAHVNFSDAGGEAFPGYVKDSGLVYADRGNGYSFGWNLDNTLNARDRDAANSPDERYDSLNHLQKPDNPNASWELAVPNGTYQVHVVSGDPANFDSVYRISVEGTLAIDATPNSTTRWFEGTVTVLVADGRLTVGNAPGANNNKVNYIDVWRV